MRTLLLFLLLAVCTASTAMARTIVFAADPSWPPMEYLDQDRRIVGFSVDYMQAVAREAGFEAQFVAMPWDTLFAGLVAGNYNAICSSVSITDERRESVDFSIPYFTVRQALIVPAGSTVATLSDLRGETVGAQISTTGYFAVKKAQGVADKAYPEIGAAIEDLLRGDIAGVVLDDNVAAQYALHTDKYKGKFKIACILDTGEDERYAVAVRKGDKQTLGLIDKGIRAVKSKGLDKWFMRKWIVQ
ncbi:basic amino acid ABC transporter substrate-binding protein [Fundidesulfovibrio butyratiphilus]